MSRFGDWFRDLISGPMFAPAPQTAQAAKPRQGASYCSAWEQFDSAARAAEHGAVQGGPTFPIPGLQKAIDTIFDVVLDRQISVEDVNIILPDQILPQIGDDAMGLVWDEPVVVRHPCAEIELERIGLRRGGHPALDDLLTAINAKSFTRSGFTIKFPGELIPLMKASNEDHIVIWWGTPPVAHRSKGFGSNISATIEKVDVYHDRLIVKTQGWILPDPVFVPVEDES